MNKLEIRQKYKTLRDAIFEDEKTARTKRLINNIKSSVYYKKAETVMIYSPIGSEIDLLYLTSDMSKTFLMPRMLKQRRMCAVKYDKDTVMIKNTYGIFEPEGKAYDGKIDLFLIPALVCDKKGTRIGYGGGYYDRFLKGMDGTKAAVLYDEFVLPQLAEEDHDIPMDAIITDKRIITTNIDLRERDEN